MPLDCVLAKFETVVRESYRYKYLRARPHINRTLTELYLEQRPKIIACGWAISCRFARYWSWERLTKEPWSDLNTRKGTF